MSLIDITLSCLLSRLNNNNLVLQGLHERSKNRHISFQTWPYSAKQTTVLTRTFSVKKRPPLFGDPFVYIDLYIYIYIYVTVVKVINIVNCLFAVPIPGNRKYVNKKVMDEHLVSATSQSGHYG